MDPDQPYPPSGVPWRLAVALAAALAAGLGVGVATSYLQGELSSSTNFLANSGAVWTVIAFLLAVWAAVRPGAGAAAGLLALLGEVLGYYAIASPLREIATSSAERELWISAALVIGPAVGCAAHYARRGEPAQRVAAVALVCGVVAGEGVYALVRLSHAVQGWIEVAIGVLGIVTCTVWQGRGWGSRALALVVTLATGAVVYGAYTMV